MNQAPQTPDVKTVVQELFPQFPRALAEEISSVASIVSFEAGTTLMRTGQQIRSTLIIAEGLVKIFREDDEGNEFFVYHLDRGKACSLSFVCAVKQETSEIMARAVTDVVALQIPLHHMDEWMLKHRSWNQFVLQSYRERFEELLITIDHIAFRNMDERLSFYLKRHRDKMGTGMLAITHAEIASELNSSREVISRLLKKMSEQGRIKMHRQFIEILDIEVK